MILCGGWLSLAMVSLGVWSKGSVMSVRIGVYGDIFSLSSLLANPAFWCLTHQHHRHHQSWRFVLEAGRSRKFIFCFIFGVKHVTSSASQLRAARSLQLGSFWRGRKVRINNGKLPASSYKSRISFPQCVCVPFFLPILSSWQCLSNWACLFSVHYTYM